MQTSPEALHQDLADFRVSHLDLTYFWQQRQNRNASKVNGDITEFPVQDNKTIINIWNYVDRLRMYKILITQTNKYFVQFGSNDTGNVLWALTLTYGKLYKTDRFSDPSNTSMCAYDAASPGCISFKSGWGGMDFFVIVMNFFAAVESKFLKNIAYEIVLVTPRKHRRNFCYSIEECRESYPQAMDVAKEFYQYLQSTMPDSTLNNVSVYNTSEDTATLLMWKAHQAAIEIGLSKFTDKLLEDGEDTILKGNFRMREKAFLSSVKFLSNLNKVTGGWFHVVWKLTVESSEIQHALGSFFINTLLLIPI
ncbi:hypothetical protein STEG23_014955, partial [Scotinomys teguina]